MPTIRRALNSDGIKNAIPVIIAGNKIDLRSNLGTSEHDMSALMSAFEEIDTCIECSVRASINVERLFYFAQRAVLHPRAPLYDTRTHSLRPAAIAALTRIFRLCDLDNDGLLSDNELQAFQLLCFRSALSPEELRGIKEVVRLSTANGVQSGGLTCSGFFFLHRNFIERGLLESTWTALRCFGYDDNLSLRRSFCRPLLPPGNTELSASAVDFLNALFNRFLNTNPPAELPRAPSVLDSASELMASATPSLDLKKAPSIPTHVEGALSSDALAQLWAPCDLDPWQDTLVANSNGHTPAMTWPRFLALWRYMAAEDAGSTMELLAFLGYGISATPAASVASAITVLASTALAQRSVFTVRVFGPPLCGKTTLLESTAELAGGLLVRVARSGMCRALLPLSDPRPVLLILDEHTLSYGDVELLGSPGLARTCDAALLMYDHHDSASFQGVLDLCGRPPALPCLLVAGRPDLPPLPQDCSESPEHFCARLSLPAPLSAARPQQLLSALLTACLSPPRKAPKDDGAADKSTVLRLGRGLALMAAAALLFLVYTRYLRRKS